MVYELAYLKEPELPEIPSYTNMYFIAKKNRSLRAQA